MRCSSCDAEVLQQAVFCHKCGMRLDVESQQFPPYVAEQNNPAGEATPPAAGPADTFRQQLAAGSASNAEPERELWQGGYSSKAMIGAWGLSGTVTLTLLILGIYFSQWWLWIGITVAVLALWAYQLLTLLYRRLNVRYTLTNQRFVHETGVLRRTTDRIEVIDMDDITVDQKVFERLVGVGTIRIVSSDTTHPNLVMPGIENVKEVAGIIDDSRCAERYRRGVHIESI